jgi:hypothetical protein
MTIPYAFRLICVCLGSFAIVFATAGFAVSLFAATVVRTAERMQAGSAARLIFGVRLFPALLATVTVAVICVPSYIRFEQRSEEEEVGMFCLLLALLTASMFAATFVRAASAWRRSIHANAVLALTGLLRHRIVISDAAKKALSDCQLSVAVRHEQAHALAGDNLKRLLMLLTPAIFPGFAALERAWKRFAEWAADDLAAGGDPQRAISLAEALVRVAKLGGTREVSPLVTSFLSSENDLEARVDRLLNPRTATGRPYGIAAAALVPACLIGTAMCNSAGVYSLLERLIH